MTTKVIISAVVGVAVGYAIYRFIGCRTGACPLNSNPYVSMAIWGAIGILMSIGK